MITGDEWNEIMYVFIGQRGVVAGIYFITLVIISYLILLNMFRAVLLNFITTATEVEKLKEDDFEERKAKI